MPAPVEFSVQIASLPPAWEGDAQALAQAIAERLTITPSEPWSSFVTGPTQPASNVGPWAAVNTWKFWSDSEGTYLPQVIDGTGITDSTITLAKLADFPAAYAVLASDADAHPTYYTGAAKQNFGVNELGILGFSNPITNSYFYATATTDQVYTSNGAQNTVNFNNVVSSSNADFNTATHRLTVTAGSVWQFNLTLQIENITTAATSVQHIAEIRINGIPGSGIGVIEAYSGAQARAGLSTTGILKFETDGYVDVSIASNYDGSATANFSVAGNAVNTRFGGHRLF